MRKIPVTSLGRIRAIGTAALAVLALAPGCGDDATQPPVDPPRPTAVTVTPAAAELAALGATGTSDRPMAILRNRRTGQVRGILRDPSTAMQAAAQARGGAAGPGIEALFSRGIPDAAAWRRR